MQDGEKKRIRIEVKLADECGNKHCDFSLTGEIYGERRKDPDMCGAITDEIAEQFPELAKFVGLHCCNYLGHPMYPIENGQYYVREESKDLAMRYLRITEDEYEALKLAEDKDEKLFFKYQLYYLGIVDRWKKEADEFIAFLEEKTGNKWVNPYKPEEERNVMHLTDEERVEVETKIADDYYTKQAILERMLNKDREKQLAIRNNIIERYTKEERKAREERDIMLYVFDNGMPIDNVIFYNHTRKVVFNWQNWGKKVTQEQFDEFMSKVDYSKLPEGIEFQLGKQK